MLLGFVDDTEFPTTRNQPDIFVFGGYFLEADKLGLLLARIAEQKTKHGLAVDDPVKWNLKDTGLRKAYETRGKKELWDQLVQVSDEIRTDLAQLLGELGATLMACALERLYDHTDQRDCYRWALENFLQRMGLMLKQRSVCLCPSVILVIDWPQRRDDKGLFDLYAAGYHHGKAVDSGQPYFSGSLASVNAFDSLAFGSTLHSAPLQLADITVGIVRDFLSWCYKGTNEQRVRQFFPFIGGLFHRGSNQRIGGNGLKVSPDPEAFDLDQKIQEICGLTDQKLQTSQEISF